MSKLALLIQECQNGNKEAQASFYRLFRPYVRKTCRLFATSPEATEDLVHDIFLKLFEKFPSYKASGTLWKWVETVAVNHATDYYKSQQKESTKLTGFSEFQQSQQQQLFMSDYDPFNVELNVENLHGLVMRLPEGYGRVFSMYVFENLSHSEIAARLRISESTSRSQLSKAKAALKSMIETIYRHQRDHGSP